MTAPADRAAILREAADDLAAAFGDPMAKHIGVTAASHLRRRAREADAASAPGRADSETQQARGRDWGDLEAAASRERGMAQNIVTALSRRAAASAGQWPPTDETQPEEHHMPDRAESPADLRQRVADAIHHDLNTRRARRDQGLLGIVPRLTDAVMAVLHPSATTATQATEPTSPSVAMADAGTVVRRELATGVPRCDEAADMVRESRDLREQIAGAIYEKCNPGHTWASAHPDDVLAYGSDADAALTVVLPHGKFMGDQLRHSEAVIQRVSDLYEQWVTAGPPPLGASMARWWDKRLLELHHAIVPPNQPTGK